MTDMQDVQLQRLFARESLPAPDPELIAAVITGVQRQRRNARVVTFMIALCILMVAAVLAPLVAGYLSQAFATLQVVAQGAALRSSHFPLITTVLMALASVGAAAWATRS
jgi:hypothetical protein